MNTPLKRRVAWMIVLTAMAAGGLGPLRAQLPDLPLYTITDLGTLGGHASAAAAINNSGQVTGWSTTADGATRAFLYSAGAMTDLGTLTGGSFSMGTALNDLGQVVGSSGINAFGPMFQEFTQGFLWENGSMRSLGALYCPCSFNRRYGTSAAFGIDGQGQVVGDSETLRGTVFRHAFLWRNGAMQDIGGGGGSFSISAAYGINMLSQVVGVFDTRAFLWETGVHQDLGTLPDHASSTARAINEPGQIVGESVSATGLESRAFLWESGVMSDLGTLAGDPSSDAKAINSCGQVVGRSGTRDGSVSRAFLWHNGTMRDLNSPMAMLAGWVFTSATGINDRGQIVGAGLHDGQVRAFLLTPALPPLF